MGHKFISASAAVMLFILSTSAFASITDEGKATQVALDSGKTCTTTWSVESSKSGLATQVFGVREMNGKTQYQVYHSAEMGKIWTWDFRIQGINCK